MFFSLAFLSNISMLCLYLFYIQYFMKNKHIILAVVLFVLFSAILATAKVLGQQPINENSSFGGNIILG